MKKTFLLLTVAALPFALASRAAAAVNPAIVSADARWLVYADFNALRSGLIGKELIAVGENVHVETAAGRVGIDWQKLLTTVGSATAYGVNISPDPKEIDGTLVISGTADFRKIAEGFLLQANLANPDAVAEVSDLPFSTYALKPENGKARKDEKTAPKAAPVLDVFIAFPPEPIVIVSKSKAQLLKAREVFRGTAPSLAKNPASPLAKFVAASDGAYLFAATTVPAEKFFDDDGAQTRILKMANSGSLALGERGENTFAHAELVANSDQMADKLMKILGGTVAALSLMETTDKQLADFLSSATVDRHDNVVTLDLAYASARLAAMIKTLREPPRPQDRTAARAAQMINGRSLAEWQAEPGPAPADGQPAIMASHTIANVPLKNGTLITLARQNNGGRDVRFEHIEIAPADGSGAPLNYRREFMRTSGPRGNWSQVQFPGADGNYNLTVSYVNDPEGKATFAVSVRDPAPARGN